MFELAERRHIASARIGRLATADAGGRPHVVPVCFALADEQVVTPIDDKPQNARQTRFSAIGISARIRMSR